MSAQNRAGPDVGLVLGGGGARGAYISGALSVLLPELKDQVRVIVGTSAGAVVASYLAANWHRPAEEAIDDELSFWRNLRFGDVCASLVAVGGATRFMRYVGEFLPLSSLHAPSLLDPGPLPRTLARLVDFEQLAENIREQRLALGVVAAPAYGNRSVVFHQGGIPRHHEDPLRGIEYVATPRLEPEHILASSAIPALFPAVRVTTPEPAAGWYYDGGSRLNTPIKPALWLGAKRVIVIALNSVAPSRTPAPEEQPDFYVGAAHLLHAALGDPLAQDIRTLANTNALIAAGLTATIAPMDVLATAVPPLASASRALRQSRSSPCPSSSSRLRTRWRSARSPGVSTASTTGAPGTPARGICGCWGRSSTPAPARCTASS